MISSTPLSMENRLSEITAALARGARLGLITSINGQQLLTILLWPKTGMIQCFETPVDGNAYASLSTHIPQAHWFERTTWDMFGLYPQGHPRLKHSHLHEPYRAMRPPLNDHADAVDDRSYHFLEVEGDGVYEIPVGPIHAGVIEPGHFRFSCYGEVIVNLEIRLGYVHRGIEKRLTEGPWKKTRFVAEAAASDMAAANALANATVLESLLDLEVSDFASLIRTIATEVERIAMHIADLGGLATDVGFSGVSASYGRLRGIALGIADLLSGNRFMRGLICPGGVTRMVDSNTLSKVKDLLGQLKSELKPVVEMHLNNQVAIDRMDGIGRVPSQLAADFGLVGVAARACGLNYDCRTFSNYASFPKSTFPVSFESAGDILARANVRIKELATSMDLIFEALSELGKSSLNDFRLQLPETLPANRSGISVVESHRGELIHLATTDGAGKIERYCIKDPSVNNWTALAIAVRNHVVADFPLCNKSFSLSYSGHDL